MGLTKVLEGIAGIFKRNPEIVAKKQEEKTMRAMARANTRAVAYENGIDPNDWISKMALGGAGIAGNAFGAYMGLPGFGSGEGENGGFLSNTLLGGGARGNATGMNSMWLILILFGVLIFMPGRGKH